jgi:hypothetical protein
MSVRSSQSFKALSHSTSGYAEFFRETLAGFLARLCDNCFT